MHKIYQNFDKLDVAFMGAFPQHALDTLEKAKLEAQEAKEPALAYLGKGEIKAHVQETGASGGFAYLFDTGPDGERWAVSKSKNTTGWNIFVSMSSMGLALHGYETMKERLYWLLQSFEVKPPNAKDPHTGLPYDKPVESISRFDFCVDFEAEAFEPDADLFSAYRVKKDKSYGQLTTNYATHRNGKHVESVTVGKLPNRQVIIYDKVKEVKNKPAEKAYWWKIWDIEPDKFEKQIWRVEARAGKNELKDGWNVTSFEDLEQKAGDIIAYILKRYRYTEPKTNDSNKNRWPNAAFWESAIQTAKSALKPYTSGADRQAILRGTWEEKRNLYINNITGNSISFAALMGLEMTALPEIFDHLKEQTEKALGDEEEALIMYQKFRDAEKRFAFFEHNAGMDASI